MNIKSNIQLLSEAAKADTNLYMETNLTYDQVREAYSMIPEAEEPMVTEAADVIINKTLNGDFYVEMTNLASFMMDSGITDISEALDIVAAANNLYPRQVGLCVESQSRVDSVLEAAKKKAKAKRDPSIMKAAADKINKNNAVIAKLMGKGYKVIKKSVSSKVCPKCGKVKGKCKCELATESAYYDAPEPRPYNEAAERRAYAN